MRQPVELCHDEGITLTQELEGLGQLDPAGQVDLRNLLREQPLAVCGTQIALLRLDPGDLVKGGGARVTDQHDPSTEIVSQGYRRSNPIVSKARTILI